MSFSAPNRALLLRKKKLKFGCNIPWGKVVKKCFSEEFLEEIFAYHQGFPSEIFKNVQRKNLRKHFPPVIENIICT